MDKDKEMLIAVMGQQMTAAQNQVIAMSQELNRVHELLMKSHELTSKVLANSVNPLVPMEKL